MACRVRARCADDKQRSSAPRLAPELYSQFADTTLANITALLALPNVRTIAEQDGFLDAYRRVTANHGVCTLYTRDRDFRKFECLEVRDPFLP